MLLAFSSSIFVLVNDIQAVNHFQNHATDATTQDCDYIEYVANIVMLKPLVANEFTFRGSTVPNQPAGVFWAVVNRLLIIFQVIILILSEVGWPAAFFDRYFPVLGRAFGLGPIGIFQCLLGAAILSHHVDDFSLVAGFFLFSLGCLNMLLGLIFRESAKTRRSIAEWRAEAKGALPSSRDMRPTFARPNSTFVPSFFKNGSEKSDGKPGFGFGAQGEKAAGLRGTHCSLPVT